MANLYGESSNGFSCVGSTDAVLLLTPPDKAGTWLSTFSNDLQCKTCSDQ